MEGAPVGGEAAHARGVRAAVLLTALLVPAVLFFAFGRHHLNLADEGYLWYGVQRTVAGEVALRDFQAYDPGRYLWCAAWAPLVGDGILGVRAAAHIYAALGLAAGLAVLAHAVRRPLPVVVGGIVLGLWLFPRHKLFEPATALVLAWGIARMLERPSRARIFVAGALVGLAAFVGRNHGLYGAVAGGAALALDAWKDRRTGLVARGANFSLGIAAGALPFALMALCAPGFARAFVDSVLFFAVKGVNQPLPWPWPWEVTLANAKPWAAFEDVMRAVAFLLPLAVPALLVVLLRTAPAAWRARAPLAGATLVAAPYVHHALVRSDMPHLAQAVAPLVLALLAAPATAGRVLRACAWGGLTLLSCAVAVTWNPTFTTTAPGATLVAHDVAGEPLQLAPAQAAYLTELERVVGREVGNAPLFVAPSRPTLYCVLGKRAPTWWISYYWAMADAEQDATIAALAEKGFDHALIIEDPIDDRADRTFQRTNPRVWAHFQERWARVPTPRLPPDHLLLRRR